MQHSDYLALALLYSDLKRGRKLREIMPDFVGVALDATIPADAL